jgi:hypothetical protein
LEQHVTITAPGIHTITMAQYLADPCPAPSLSSSCAHTLLTGSPAHAALYHPRLGGASDEPEDDDDDDKANVKIGVLAHDLLLGGPGGSKICVIEPADYPAGNGNIPKGWTNKAIQTARDTAKANGLLPVLGHQMAGARKMAAAAKAFINGPDSPIRGCLEDGTPELTMVWREGETWCRARPDWLTRDYRLMLHFKTTAKSARPDQFIRGIMESMGYDTALAFYKRGLDALLDADMDFDSQATQHMILVQEQHPPYACSLIDLSPAKMAIAQAKVMRALRIWQSCMTTGHWPAYSAQVHSAEPTPWQLAQAEEMLMQEHAN